ncbi:hypothetical protein Taro_027259 [Colocasia esculenta]|uniref:SAM-dependent MTase RsmB/NOP-type domain-containing protein n=1 Tax=Colocasia esculenta TaxID=4460 RepID=A0A843VTT1_COLES|nr:hypothetical protein [Colocasia esculenta]
MSVKTEQEELDDPPIGAKIPIIIKEMFLFSLLVDVLEGEIFLQNLPSIIAAHILDPHEGERILDMCAAPGGKTTAIAALMRDKGEVIALDRSHNKDCNSNRKVPELLFSNRKNTNIDWRKIYTKLEV